MCSNQESRVSESNVGVVTEGGNNKSGILTPVNQNPEDKSCRTTVLNSANAPNGGCFNHRKMHIHEQTTGREQNVSDTLNSDAGEGF